MNKKGITTKRRIKETAYQLFAEKGFKEVTMKDICEAAGLSRGGLYGHYESTRQIFQEIVDDLMGCQEEEFSSKIADGLPAVRILDDVLKRYQNEMIDSGRSLSLAIYEYFSHPDIAGRQNELYEQYMLSFHMWEKLIQYGIAAEEFQDADAAAVFDLIVFSYQGVRMYSKLMPVDREIPRRIVKEIRRLLVRDDHGSDI